MRLNVNVVVQFYPWFEFHFPLFKNHYYIIHYQAQKQKKIKFKPRIKLNQNINIPGHSFRQQS